MTIPWQRMQAVLTLIAEECGKGERASSVYLRQLARAGQSIFSGVLERHLPPELEGTTATARAEELSIFLAGVARRPDSVSQARERAIAAERFGDWIDAVIRPHFGSAWRSATVTKAETASQGTNAAETPRLVPSDKMKQLLEKQDATKSQIIDDLLGLPDRYPGPARVLRGADLKAAAKTYLSLTLVMERIRELRRLEPLLDTPDKSGIDPAEARSLRSELLFLDALAVVANTFLVSHLKLGCGTQS